MGCDQFHQQALCLGSHLLFRARKSSRLGRPISHIGIPNKKSLETDRDRIAESLSLERLVIFDNNKLLLLVTLQLMRRSACGNQ